MVVYCVVGILARRSRPPTTASGVAPLAGLARRLNGGVQTPGNEPGHLGVVPVGKTVPDTDACRRWAWTGCSDWP